MNDDYNRIEVNKHALKERKEHCREVQKNRTKEISHEKQLNNWVARNSRIRRGLKVTALHAWKKTKRGLVYINNNPYNLTSTPSHNTDVLLNLFPSTVKADVTDELGNGIYMPFELPDWKFINDETKPYFYQLALSEQETLSNHEYKLIPFVFNESKALTEAIYSQKLSRMAYMVDRLGKELKSALNRSDKQKFQFWLMFETAMHGQPHYQGSILLRTDELYVAREAFYKLNRKMTDDEKQGALRFRIGKRKELFNKRGQLYTDLNWADYNIKERGNTKLYYADHTNCTRIVAASNLMRSNGKDFYNRLRVEFNAKNKTTDTTTKNQKTSTWGSW